MNTLNRDINLCKNVCMNISCRASQLENTYIFNFPFLCAFAKQQYVTYNMILSVEKFNYNLELKNIPKFYVKSNFMLKNNLHQVMYLVVVLTSNAASALLLFTTKNLIIPLFCKFKITCKLLTNNLNNQDSSIS